ncbi:8-amino-7-oxononanoate synthase [Acetobacteraceae bacterium ESL0709]|nr:8-amino-7-oxononanoate synthase [Acetobacteraceae bacterium ESL0697]MDF7677215.1 8-amino-7-oxononanoate synthase [Acetobacteraceae bacterium ESL0709]
MFRQPYPVRRQGNSIFYNGKWLIDVASNDYLGLSHHSFLRKRAAEWAECYGTGSCASRLVNGTLDLHQQLEEKLARFKHNEAALLFATGWQANTSLIPALNILSRQSTGHDALIFADRLNHASLHMGCTAAAIRQHRFRHNDLNHLEALLTQEASRPGLKFIITESVFSMDGDRADIKALRTLADRFEAALYIDEAHATGVLGPDGQGLGCGLADITISTASKALGGMGAFITGSRELCDFLANFASGFVYSTALPPSVLGAIDAALELMPSLESTRLALQHKAEFLRRELARIGAKTGLSTTQIIPVMVGEASNALTLAAYLREEGFFCTAIRPPTVPLHTARLRLALNAELTIDELRRLVSLLAATFRTPS